jgi:hypothetical protein
MSESGSTSPQPRMDLLQEYEHLTKLERATTTLRYQTFTALLTVSFLLPGFAFGLGNSPQAVALHIWGHAVSMTSILLIFGLMFFGLSVIFYNWYHRYSHIYRHRLKEMEEELDIRVYRLRVRPQIGRMKLHFVWCLYIVGGFYFISTAQVAGWLLTTSVGVASLAVYGVLMFISRWRPEEPVEIHRSRNSK